jgi:hypothetical protein
LISGPTASAGVHHRKERHDVGPAETGAASVFVSPRVLSPGPASRVGLRSAHEGEGPIDVHGLHLVMVEACRLRAFAGLHFPVARDGEDYGLPVSNGTKNNAKASSPETRASGEVKALGFRDG